MGCLRAAAIFSAFNQPPFLSCRRNLGEGCQSVSNCPLGIQIIGGDFYEVPGGTRIKKADESLNQFFLSNPVDG